MLVCIFLGFLLAVQFRTQERISKEFAYQREENLTSLLTQVEKERKDLETEVADLRKKLQDYEEGNGAKAGNVIKEELANSMASAGMSGLQGQGLQITMKDSTKTIQPGEDPNVFLIHDTDILKIVNELKAAGAEAISVNEQRITAMTEIRCAGPTILVNSVRLAPPYVINAVGQSDTLLNAMKMPGGIVETLLYYNISVDMVKKENIKIPAYKGSMEFKYAKEWKEG